MKNLLLGIIGRSLFSALFLLTVIAPQQAAAYKWWADDAVRGHSIYFYDKEMRNGAVSVHLWHRDNTLADDGVTVTGHTDTPMYEWNDRKKFEFTGKKVEIDGEFYPVYRYDFYCYSYTPNDAPYADGWNFNDWTTPTHMLIRHEESDPSKCESTPDMEFVDDALYSLDGSRIDNFDTNSLVDITDEDFKKYTVYITGDPNKYGSYIQSLTKYFTVHVWGPDGDLTPWAFNGSCTFIDENPAETSSNYTVWTDEFGYSPVIKYDFYYRGATPTNIIIKYRRSADDWDRQTADLTFRDGALYTIGEVGHYCEPLENPEIDNYMPEIEGDFYFIDTDRFYKYEKDEATGQYRLSTNTWSTLKFERQPKVDYLGTIPTSIDNYNPTADVKFTKLGEFWYPVVKVSLGNGYNKVRGKIKQIRMNVNRSYEGERYTGWMDFDTNNVYYFAGGGAVHAPIKIDDLTLYDSIPEEDIAKPLKKTIYVHFGANQLMEKELWKIPYCIPYRRIPGTDPFAPIYSSEYELQQKPVDFPAYIDPTSAEYAGSDLQKCEMTYVSPGLYKYEIDNANDFDDFVCFYWGRERVVTRYEYITEDEYWNNRQKYAALGAEYYYNTETGENSYRYPVEWGLVDALRMSEMTASRSTYFDPVHWADYVYDIGIDCFHPSYLTPEQYFAVEDMIKENNVEALYLVGNEPVSGIAMSDPSDSRQIDNDHGCFFFDFDVTEDLPATFKASVVNVPGIVKDLIPGSYIPQRGWASFNLGLIGPHKDVDDADYDEWYASHVIQGGKSREVCIRTNETYDFDNYTQYLWRIEANQEHGRGPGRYYMVFDLLEEDHTVTVLDFDPHPHCYVNDIDIRILDMNSDQAELLHDGQYLDGSSHSGKVLFDKVNVASGTINVGDTDNTLIGREGYEVVYTIYVDDRLAFYQDKMTVDGRPEAIVADFLDLSADVRYAVRGRYHDLKTGRYFASKQEEEGIDALIEQLPAPSVSVLDKSMMFYMSGDNYKDVTLGAAANLSYDVDSPADFELEYLPDYEVTGASLDGNTIDNISAPLIHNAHWIVTRGNNPWKSYLGTPENPWQIHDGESALTEANNWSHHIKNTNELPVLIDRMRLYEENIVPQASAAADYSIHAVYPFLATDFEAKVVIVPDKPGSKSKAAAQDAADNGLTSSVPDALDEYKLVRVKRSTPIHVDFDNGVVTGVENVTGDNDNPDAPAEYFNLQGMRIDADNLTPGIYIERKGTKTRKIIVN